jgi:spore coat polysaccharide biosynthesis protein SpsF
MNIIAIIQARTGSSRLPGKVLKEVEGKTLLQLHLERVLQSRQLNKVVVATTQEPGDNAIITIADKFQIPVYRGSSDDVLDRYYQAAQPYQPDYIVRLTSDCPLIDAQLIDEVIAFALKASADYVSNTLKPTFPDGQDVEVFRYAALEKAWKEAKLRSEREHVTSYIWKNSTYLGGALFSSDNYVGPEDFSQVRMTVDEPFDLDIIKILVKALGGTADWKTYVRYYMMHADEMRNSVFNRNEGYLKSMAKD